MITELWLRVTQRIQRRVARTCLDDKGQGLVEYALILAIIAIAVVVALQFLQPAISTQLNNVANGI